jgi:hypothetical protein
MASPTDSANLATLRTPDWANILNKPSTFPPSIHTHVPGDVTGTAVITTDSRLSDARTPLAHNHVATDVNSGTLDGDRLPALSTTKKGGAPATGTPSGLFLKDDGTWATPAGGGGGSGPDATPRDRTEWWIQKNAGTITTIANIGHATAPTTRGVGAAFNDSTGNYLNYPTLALADSQAGWCSPVWNEVRIDQRPIATFLFKTGANATDTNKCRYWIGLTSATLKAQGDPALHVAAIRYVTNLDTLTNVGYWRTYTNDGSGTGTVTITTLPVKVNQRYSMKIVPYGNGATIDSIVFYNEGVRISKHTTDLPALTTGLGYYCIVQTRTTVARNIRIKKIHMETR